MSGQISADDQQFLEKKAVFCQNRCKFKNEPIVTEVEQIGDNIQVQKVCKLIMYCEYCGFFDDVTLANESVNESEES